MHTFIIDHTTRRTSRCCWYDQYYNVQFYVCRRESCRPQITRTSTSVVCQRDRERNVSDLTVTIRPISVAAALWQKVTARVFLGMTRSFHRNVSLFLDRKAIGELNRCRRFFRRETLRVRPLIIYAGPTMRRFGFYAAVGV